MPKTKLAQRLRGPTYKWFGGIVGSHLSLMGMDQMDLPGRSAPTWRKYIREPGTMDLAHFILLMDTLNIATDERHKILDLLTEDIRGDKKWQKSKQEHN